MKIKTKKEITNGKISSGYKKASNIPLTEQQWYAAHFSPMILNSNGNELDIYFDQKNGRHNEARKIQ